MARTKVRASGLCGLMGRNWLINGCMRIWQRGVGPSANTHTADAAGAVLGHRANGGPTLAQAKTAKMEAILAAADDFLGQRCCGYTEMEKVSWEQRAQEATELATDPAVEAVSAEYGG